jgi:outer membrane lipoprotein-sorting protein
MKKISTLLMVVLTAAFGLSVQAQSVDEILAKHFEVVGQEKLLNVESMTSEGKMNVMGIEAPFTQIMARGGKMRMEISIQGFTILQVFDGENGWSVNPMMGPEPVAMSGVEMAQMVSQADMDGPLYNYKEKGHTLELIGKEEFQGADVYKMRMTQKDGTEIYIFMDADAYVPLKMEVTVNVEGMEVTSTTEMGAYKEVDGMVIAHEVKTSTMGQAITIVLDKVEVNTEIPANAFAKPGK